MNESRLVESLQALARPSGRRAALSALGVAGMSLLAALGLTEGSDGRQGGKSRGGNGRQKQKTRRQRDANHASRDSAGPTPAGPDGAVQAQANDKKNGPTGPTGPTGPAGPQGVSGAAGVAGPAGVSGWQQAASTTGQTTESFKRVDVTCPGSKKVLGGGYQVFSNSSSHQIEVAFNYPIAANQWRVVANNKNPDDATWQLAAYAICADVG